MRFLPLYVTRQLASPKKSLFLTRVSLTTRILAETLRPPRHRVRSKKMGGVR